MRGTIWRQLLASCVAFQLSLLGVAQTQAPAAKAERPTVRTTVRLVQVSAIVHDRKGQPIGDLTRDDFVLLDGNQPQPIQLFALETSRTTPGTSKPLPENTYTNRLDRYGEVPTSVTLILLDGLNTRFEDIARSRAQILKFLGQLRPEDRVALYALSTNLRILHDFTSDAAALTHALGLFEGRASSSLDTSERGDPRTGISALDDWLRDSYQQMAAYYQADRAHETAVALESIANHVATVPGRKNLVWVSGSFPIQIGFDSLYPAEDPGRSGKSAYREQRTFTEEIERAARALNNANLAVYPVDARGLLGPPMDPIRQRDPLTEGPVRGIAAENRSQGGGRPGLQTRGIRTTQPVTTMTPSQAEIPAMLLLAQSTGGLAFYNTNDILGSIRRAIDDSQVTYVLGYYPTHGRWDGQFREIKVQVKRPEMTVRHRRGYFAFPERPLDDKQRETLVRDAAWSPLDATGLGFTVRLLNPGAAGSGPLKIQFTIDAHDATLQLQEGHWVGLVDLLFSQRDAAGNYVGGLSQTLDLHLTPETYERAKQAGLSVTTELNVAPGASELRVVVSDRPSGALGSVTIPLKRAGPRSDAGAPLPARRSANAE